MVIPKQIYPEKRWVILFLLLCVVGCICVVVYANQMYMQVCVPMQRKLLGILLCHSMAYSLEMVSLKLELAWHPESPNNPLSPASCL